MTAEALRRPALATATRRPYRQLSVLRNSARVAAVGAAAVAATFVLPPYRTYQLALVAAYLCATAGLTVLVGMSGQLSLGHGALMAVGAYTVALAQTAFYDAGRRDLAALVASLAAAVAVTTVAGLVVGLAAARLRGPYLAGLTLALAMVVPAVTTVWSSTFNAEQGLWVPVPRPPAALGRGFPAERWLAWVAVGAALATLLVLTNLVRGRFGRDMCAVRDDEVAARVAGIGVARTQVLAFVVSAACAGLAGGVLAALNQSASPGAFSLELSLFLVMAVVVGGLGSLAGAAWGALLLVALPELSDRATSLLPLSPSAAQRIGGNLPLAIFGLTLVVVVSVAPGGLQRALARAGRRTVRSLQKGG